MQASIEYIYGRVRRWWSWALLTPIIYLLLAWAMDKGGWVETHKDAVHPWDIPATRGVIVGLAAALLVGLGWFRVRRSLCLRRLDHELTHLLSSWTRQFYVMAALSDSLAFLGLVYFLLSGRPWVLLAGGAVSYIGYALTYPPRSDLNGLKSVPADPEH